MKKIKIILIVGLIICIGIVFYSTKNSCENGDDSCIISYIINPKNQELKLYWKNQQGKNYLNFEKLKTELEKNNQELVFAMNGGIYRQDNSSPLGLFIEEGIVKTKINNVKEASGNFYLQPNGIFLLTDDNRADVCKTSDYKEYKNIKYATQSGPMLIIDGLLNSKFNKGSKNRYIRNGVGILPDGRIIFAISKKKINFFDFATFFKNKGCKNALYLDGYVSKCYLPSKKQKEMNGKFGVIIAETKFKN